MEVLERSKGSKAMAGETLAVVLDCLLTLF